MIARNANDNKFKTHETKIPIPSIHAPRIFPRDSYCHGEIDESVPCLRDWTAERIRVSRVAAAYFEQACRTKNYCLPTNVQNEWERDVVVHLCAYSSLYCFYSRSNRMKRIFATSVPTPMTSSHDSSNCCVIKRIKDRCKIVRKRFFATVSLLHVALAQFSMQSYLRYTSSYYLN